MGVLFLLCKNSRESGKRVSFKNAGYSANPFRLQNALHSAPKLLFLRWGVTLGLPIRETRIGALSSACGRRARFANAQAFLAISVTLNPAQRARDSNP